MTKARQWFVLDTEGYSQVVARRGKPAILFELIANAFDAPGTSTVAVQLRRAKKSRTLAEVMVEDDSPDGFSDLEHAYVMYKPSERKGVAEQRGRWAAGEKSALSLMDRACVETTKGTIVFTSRGRTQKAAKRARGTLVWGQLPATDEELGEMQAAVRRVLVPEGIALTLNGDAIPYRAPLKVVTATLPTELADDSGRLRPTRRKTTVRIHRPLDGEEAALYELGIPVTPCGDTYTLDVQMKVPLGQDRDAVTAGYLSQLRAIVLEAMTEDLTSEAANSVWARDALERHGDKLPVATVSRILDLRFGERRVAFDPTDRESNARAVAAGYTVVHGSQMSAAEWAAAKRAEAIKPAGQVTPSPRPDSEGGAAREYLNESKWTPAIREVVALTRRVSAAIIGAEIEVRVASDVTWPFAATYGARRFTYNVGRLGHRFFEGPIEDILDLINHELGHEWASSHLSDDYYRALTKIGGKMTALALTSPHLFAMRRAFAGDAEATAQANQPASAPA